MRLRFGQMCAFTILGALVGILGVVPAISPVLRFPSEPIETVANDPDAACFGYFVVDCPTAKNCSDTECDVPSEAVINGSNAYSLDDIGLPVGNNQYGVLLFRSQDVLCPNTAIWDESHSLPEYSCRTIKPNETASIPERPYKGRDPSNLKFNAVCYTRKKCGISCDPTPDYIGPFTMTKTVMVNGVPTEESRKYLIPRYRCNDAQDIFSSTVKSDDYFDCDESVPCHPPVESNPG